MSKKYRIYVDSCGQSVAIDKELTEDELEVVKMIASEVTEASDYVSISMESVNMDGNIELWTLSK